MQSCLVYLQESKHVKQLDKKKLLINPLAAVTRISNEVYIMTFKINSVRARFWHWLKWHSSVVIILDKVDKECLRWRQEEIYHSFYASFSPLQWKYCQEVNALSIVIEMLSGNKLMRSLHARGVTKCDWVKLLMLDPIVFLMWKEPFKSPTKRTNAAKYSGTLFLFLRTFKLEQKLLRNWTVVTCTYILLCLTSFITFGIIKK